MLFWPFMPKENNVPELPGAKKPSPKKPKLTLAEAIRDGTSAYRKLFPFLAKYKSRFIVGIIAGAGTAALTAGQAQTLHYVTKHAFREGMQTSAHMLTVTQVMWICSLLPLIIIARSICDYLENYCMGWVSLRVLHDLRTTVFNHILNQSLDFFNQAKIGSLMSRVSNDSRVAQMALTAVTDDVIVQPLTVIFVICEMLSKDWRFTLYSLCVFPLCIFPITFYGRKVRRTGREDEARSAELMVIMHEALAGIRLVKSLTREDYERQRFDESSRAMVAASQRVRRAMQSVAPMIESMSALGVGAGLVYVYYSHMEVSKFMTLIACLFLLYNPVKRLSKIHVSIQKAIAATTKIFELLDVEPTVKDAPDAIALEKANGEIRFENVTFSYHAKRAPAALRGVSLDVHPGKSYALVGVSGSGKSTMLSLLLRFYDPAEGRILLDGHDLRQIM